MTAKVAKHKLIWDTGASLAFSGDRNDFVGLLTPIKPIKINGVHGTTDKPLSAQLQGHVAWSIQDTTGCLRTFKVKALYVPNLPVRLMPPQAWKQAFPDKQQLVEVDGLHLSGIPGDATWGPIIA